MNLITNGLSKLLNKMKFFGTEQDHEKDPNALEYKILILGESSVGKTSICTRFAKNEFNLEIKPTSELVLYTKSVKLGEQMINLFIVDIDEGVMSNDRKELYRDVKGALVVYDVTKSKSFDKVDNWILDLRQNSSLNTPVVLVGNKSDLNFLKNVDYEEGVEKANTLNCGFKETSCVDLESVKDAFKLLIAKIFYQELPESKKNYFKVSFSSHQEDNLNVREAAENDADKI